jgi:glycosyltransferase involved in cell wall biosynthesis
MSPPATTLPCRRFVFASHVKDTKGVREIIQAGEQFGDDIEVDLYGELREGFREDAFSTCRRVRYRGVIPPDKVMTTLASYDALLLPTYYDGEGYPGIVLEAFAAGLPVICTRWQSLPDIVDESCGLLIEPKNADALYAAMKKLAEDKPHFDKLREGALARGRVFSTEVWADRFVDFCRSVVKI